MKEIRLPEASGIAFKHGRILRGPHQIAFDLTNKCNFRCLHCFNLSGENYIVKNELKDDEVIKFIKDITKLKPMNFCFCGGEPLLREKVLLEASAILSSSGTIVSLVTNGSLMTREKAKRFNNMGITRVQVSFDGSRAETHEKLRQYKNAFELAVDSIKYFCEAGYKEVMVAFTPTTFNCSEFKQMFYFCRELGVDIVRIQPLMILGRANLNLEKIVPTPLQYRKLVREINEIKIEYGSEKIIWGDPVDHLIRFRTVAQHCINFLSIQANGAIIASPYLPLTLGNIRRHSVNEYWDAGLARIWELPVVKEYAKKIHSIVDLKESDVWFNKNVELDIIDNLFKN